MIDKSYYDVRGAVYFPSRAYNAYQTYEYFNDDEIDRDFGYAEKAGLNALRIFTSYEQYRKDSAVFFSKFDRLLAIAYKHGIRVMAILFENCGLPFTIDNALSRDPMKAVCVQSPGRDITSDSTKWAEPFGYIRDFMSRYADDRKLLAIEVMNEPHMETDDVPFALEAVKTAYSLKGTVPITMGLITLDDSMYFLPYLDILQIHDNFPVSLDDFSGKLRKAAYMQKIIGKPIWISEWQRLRKSGPGWDVAVIPEEEKGPALHTLSDIVKSSGLGGNFFWCLMVKPAYLQTQRPNGTFNGLFHEDGRVSSIADYEAISGKPGDGLEQLYSMPAWYISDLGKA